ncbi:MAG TPA: RagB/SusD family nutrient uptake outer membrane protein [Hanamia sp.]|nr:RagB/SusD family nutrient uptake outer membrane protein [Hanamia sp.]
MKTNKNYFLLYGCVLLLAVGLYSCKKDFLDNTDKTKLTDVNQWASEGNADIFLNDIYNNLPDMYNSPENLDNFTDDNDAGFYYGSWNFKQGIVNPASTYYVIWGGDAGTADISRFNWTDAYNTIRKCNLFIQKIAANRKNFSDDWYNKRLDEVRFLRAFYYSNLFLHLGGVPIITEPQTRDDSTTLFKARNTYEETFNFLVSSLDTVVNDQYLAVKYNQGDANAGRATLGAALMLKAWLQLNAASPAYNSATAPGGPDPNKIAGFGNVDNSRWATAAATFKKFIDEYGNGSPYGLFPEDSTLWFEANEYNSEVIWDRQYVPTTMGSTFEQYGGPVWINGAYYTWGNYDPTQELVDQFFMANGKSITDPTSGYDPQNPYKNRERRFYKWIVYDGAPYKMDWMTKEDTIYTRIDQVHPSKNQIDFASDDVGNTGYYFKKKLNPLVRPGGGPASGANYVYFRYTEVLLGYAEAQNEATGPDASVYDAINKIRERSDLPALPDGLTQEQMRDAIHHERRVELCFENKRFYDIIRWKIADQVMNVDKHAMKITNTSPSNNSGVWKYEVVPLNHPHTFHMKMYLTPIPQPVIAQNPKLVQNPGY